MHYWGRYPEPTSLEVYHLGKGLGTIRFESKNRQEPSGVHYQYAESFERYTPPDLPALPWFDPFDNRTYVRNGFCEDFLVPPAQGGAVGDYLRGWSGRRTPSSPRTAATRGRAPGRSHSAARVAAATRTPTS